MKTGNDVAEIEMVYQLFPSCELLAYLRQLGGFQLPGDTRYDCKKPLNNFYRAFNNPV